MKSWRHTAHHSEIEQGNAVVGCQKDIPGVRIGMEETLNQNLVEIGPKKLLRFRLLAKTKFLNKEGEPIRDSLLHPGDQLSVNYGTLYPALLKLEQEGYIASEWGVSDNNRKAKYYRLTRAGQKQVAKEAREWEQATAIIARFLAPEEERS